MGPRPCYPYWEGPHSVIVGTTPATYDYKRPGGCNYTYDPANPMPFLNPETFGRWGLSGEPVLDDWSYFFAIDRARREGRLRGKAPIEVSEMASLVHVSETGEGSSHSTPYHSVE